MGTLGMYKEAIDLLSKKLIVDTPELKGTITVLTAVFMGTCQTTPVQNMKNKYRTLVEKYRDSSLIYIKKTICCIHHQPV
jgi:hypothetical protein